LNPGYVVKANILPPRVTHELRSKGFFSLEQIVNWEMSTNWQHKWLIREEIGLGEDLAEVWKPYTNALKDSNVKLGENEDQLLWSLDPFGTYAPK
jgi:hypothetical protein